MAGLSAANQPMSYGQFTTGIIPFPGTPAYEAMLRNIISAQPIGNTNAIGDAKQQAQTAYDQLKANTGTSFGLMGGGGSSSAGSSSSSSSSSGAGGGLLDEILGLIRGTGEKQFSTARARLGEDIAQARMDKVRDLTRRGLFRAGSGEEEIQREIEKPYMRGMSDLESNLADANVDVGLRKASILADIEAAQRKAMAEAMANAGRAGASGYGGGGGRGGGKGDGGDGEGGAAFPGVIRLNASRKGGTYLSGAHFIGGGGGSPPPPPPGQSVTGSTAGPPGISTPLPDDPTIDPNILAEMRLRTAVGSSGRTMW